MDHMPAQSDFLTPKAGELAALGDLSGPLAARALFWRARYLQEAGILPHLPFLFWLMASIRPRTYVELGMVDAVSYFAACQTLDKIGADGRCIGVWDQAPETPIPAEIAQRNAELYAEFSQMMNGSVAQAAACVDDGTVDLLVVNLTGKNDLSTALSEEWLAKLSDSAVLVFNGTGTAGFQQNTAAPLLEELRTHHPHIDFDEGDGVSVLLVGSDCHESLLGFAALNPNDANYRNAKNVFHRLGSAHVFEWQARRDQKRCKDAQWQLDRLQKEVSTRTAHAQERAAQTALLQSEIFDLRRNLAQLTERAQQVLSLQAELAALRDAVADCRAQHQEAQDARFREIATLTETLQTERAEHGSKAATLQAAMATREDELTRQLATLQSQLPDALALERQLSEAKAEALSYRDKYAAITRSTFWRMTGPVRRTVDQARKLKG